MTKDQLLPFCTLRQKTYQAGARRCGRWAVGYALTSIICWTTYWFITGWLLLILPFLTGCALWGAFLAYRNWRFYAERAQEYAGYLKQLTDES